VWKLPGERTKNGNVHLVHLSPQALAILDGLPEIADVNKLVFPMSRGGRHRGFSNIKRRVDEAMRVELAKLGREFKHWTWHDLRRTATTLMAERLRVAPHVVDKILNHTSSTIRGVARVYNRSTYLEERKDALERWGRLVDRLVHGSAVNVVELHRSA
jgi:integrase